MRGRLDMARNLGLFTRAVLRAYERAQEEQPDAVEQVADLAEQKIRERLVREGKREGRVKAADWNAAQREVATQQGQAML